MADSQSAIAKLLAGLNSTMSDPNSSGLTGFAQGLLQASAPHMLTPVSGGQALGMGAAASQQYQQQSLQNALTRTAVLPFQQQRTLMIMSLNKTLNDPNASPADKANARAIYDKIVGGDPNADPVVVKATTAARAQETPAGPGQGGSEYAATHGENPIRGPQLPGTIGDASTGSTSVAPGALPTMGALDWLKQSLGSMFTAGSPVFDLKSGTSYPAPLSSQLGGNAPRTPQAAIAGAQAIAGQPQAPPPQAMPPQGAPPQQPPQAAPMPPRPMPQPAPRPAGPVGLGPSVTAGMQTAQEQATKQLGDNIKSGQEAQQQVASLEELNQIASHTATGPGTEGRVAAQKALAWAGGALGFDTSKLGSITNAQVFNKTATNFALQAVSSAGQTAYNSLDVVLKAVPALANTNLANSVVTGSLLALARYKAAQGQFSSNWQTKNNGMGFVPGQGSSDAAWTKQAPYMAYFMQAMPPEVQQQLMKAAQGNLTLRRELDQAFQATGGLKQSGYL